MLHVNNIAGWSSALYSLQYGFQAYPGWTALHHAAANGYALRNSELALV